MKVLQYKGAYRTSTIVIETVRAGVPEKTDSNSRRHGQIKERARDKCGWRC